MRIKTSAEYVNEEIQLISLMPVSGAELKEKRGRAEDGSEGDLKLAPNGKVQYKTPFKVMALDENGNPKYEERNVSVTILDRVDIRPAEYYEIEGDVWITPYSAGNQVGLSIIAESVEPAGSGLPRLMDE